MPAMIPLELIFGGAGVDRLARAVQRETFRMVYGELCGQHSGRESREPVHRNAAPDDHEDGDH